MTDLRLVKNGMTPKVNDVVLEVVRYNAAHPHFGPTCQFMVKYGRYYPNNPKAAAVCKLARSPYLLDYQLEIVKDLGFSIEVRP